MAEEAQPANHEQAVFEAAKAYYDRVSTQLVKLYAAGKVTFPNNFMVGFVGGGVLGSEFVSNQPFVRVETPAGMYYFTPGVRNSTRRIRAMVVEFFPRDPAYVARPGDSPLQAFDGITESFSFGWLSDSNGRGSKGFFEDREILRHRDYYDNDSTELTAFDRMQEVMIPFFNLGKPDASAQLSAEPSQG